MPNWLNVADNVAAAVATGHPVVALESTLIAHGLPWPSNLETALAAADAVRASGAVPATVAVWYGTPTVGLRDEQIEELARAHGVMKASRRDLGAAVALKKLAATTVSATMALAHSAGVRVFATGGIGGAHLPERGTEDELRAPLSARRVSFWDVSADLTELARTPVLVVCAGAKSILDLPRTLEMLETLGVPVIGYRTGDFPAFYVRSGMSLPVSVRVESATGAGDVFAAHVHMGGGGAVLVQQCPEDVAISSDVFGKALDQALAETERERVTGPQVTPFLLARLAEITGGQTLIANRALIVSNAGLAANVAVVLAEK